MAVFFIMEMELLKMRLERCKGLMDYHDKVRNQKEALKYAYIVKRLKVKIYEIDQNDPDARAPSVSINWMSERINRL
jgi:hypothetical protein